MVCTLTYIIGGAQCILIEPLCIYIMHILLEALNIMKQRKTTFLTQACGGDIRRSWMSIQVANFIGFSEK